MSNRKKINKLIRRNAEIVREMLKHPDMCFCREMDELAGKDVGIDWNEDIDWDHPIGITEPYEYFHVLMNRYMTSTGDKIYQCRRCGKKYIAPILIA